MSSRRTNKMKTKTTARRPEGRPLRNDATTPCDVEADLQVRLPRRTFIKAAGTSTAAVLMSGLPAGWVGSAFAQDGPEVRDMRFGIIALTDCAPIVMAHELGYFKQFGINSVISKEASWAVIRDKLTLGENHATHMLIGMPIASTMGLAGSP